MLYVFIGCLTFGVVYSAISALLGGVHGFGHGGFDHGGIGHGGVDHAGAGHAGAGTDAVHTGAGTDTVHAGAGTDTVHAGANANAGHTGETHAGASHGTASQDSSPSPLNPLVIAGAITAFGAVGLISKTGFGLGDFLSTALALVFAGAIGTLMFFGIVKLVYSSQSNSMFSLEDLIGTEAEVITPIPAKGLGEVACAANGVRYNLSAGSQDGAIPRGAKVIIRDLSGNAAIVQKKITIDEVEAFEAEIEKSRESEKN